VYYFGKKISRPAPINNNKRRTTLFFWDGSKKENEISPEIVKLGISLDEERYQMRKQQRLNVLLQLPLYLKMAWQKVVEYLDV
jgi:hypothetical protein